MRRFPSLAPPGLRPRWTSELQRCQSDYLLQGAPVPATVSGRINVSLHRRPKTGAAAPGQAGAPVPHRHVWVNGPHYAGMEDNDLRGFLDGRFIAAWNQPQQIHVRLGRIRDRWTRYGEWEVFRVLQRWTDLRLPVGATVAAARLELDVEQDAARELEILLYQVHKDWQPGAGGIERNNNSVPVPGEVWWNEVGHDTAAWGLPGAGFASDSHANADTPVMPLALARYRPGDASVAFQSGRLAAYIEERASRGEPLLFLLKVSDYLEDVPGTCISIYSCNHGDSGNTARRPRLALDWTSPNELASLEREVILEHGRSLVLPRLEGEAAGSVAVSFEPDDSGERPTLSVRGGNGDETSAWLPAELPLPLEADWSWVEVRMDACVNPLPVGQAFTATLRDTWVITGAPEEQEVRWVFESPTGSRHTTLADYAGDSSWQVTFIPDEPGRWRYQWFQSFSEEPYESAPGVFDVVPGGPGDREGALQALDQLIDYLNASDLRPGWTRIHACGVTFNRLQRGLMDHETPESFAMDGARDGGKAGPRLDEARAALSGQRPGKPRLFIDYPNGVVPPDG